MVVEVFLPCDFVHRLLKITFSNPVIPFPSSWTNW